MNSVMMYAALVKAGVLAELHIFQHGAHGAGLALANSQLSVCVAGAADEVDARAGLRSGDALDCTIDNRSNHRTMTLR